jgi:hypothetical protein
MRLERLVRTCEEAMGGRGKVWGFHPFRREREEDGHPAN